MIVSYLQVLLWAYGLGFAAAAPIGPVNTVAIHRGVVGKWSHTLSVGMGSVMVDLAYFTLALWGGQKLLWYLQQPRIQDVLAVAGAAVLLPLGVLLVVRVFRYDHSDLLLARQRKRQAPPRHLWTDVGTGILLTVINPAAPIYWAATGAPWLAAAQPHLKFMTIWWGLAAAGAGMTSWFCILTALVRFTPRRIGPRFFRAVYGACGLMLLAFAVFCLRIVVVHHWVFIFR